MAATTPAAKFDAAALRGWGRLAVDGTVGLADLVEAMHREIAAPFPCPRRHGRTRGVTGLVYRSIRGTARLVGLAYEAALDQLGAADGELDGARRAGAVHAVLNGVAGDYLAETANPLAIPMRLRRGGVPLVLERDALASAVADPRRSVVVLVHGSCLHDLAWARDGHDHGAALERDLGYTALYLHYNTGLHVSTNGRLFSAVLEQLVAAWPVPVERLVLLGHSMGGLVIRSACHQGTRRGLSWPRRVDACFFLGTPHLGAPLERSGHVLHTALRVSRYSAPLAKLGAIRSAGVTDLRHGSIVDEDWMGRDRFARAQAAPTPVALPQGVRCFAIAACTSRAGALVGDGLVPLRSALGRHRDPRRALAFPEERRYVARGVGHLGLLGDAGVYAFIRRALQEHT